MLNFYAHEPPESDPEELAILEGLADVQPYIGDRREPEHWLLTMGGITFDLLLKPHPRDVRLWFVFRDGVPWLASVGRERVWRAMQAEIAQPLGRKHWQ